MSERFFSRAFHRSTGLPPYHYLTFRRIKCAKALVHSTGLPLVEVELHGGFRSYDRFAAMFRRLVGTSPRRFRGVECPRGEPRCAKSRRRRAWFGACA